MPEKFSWIGLPFFYFLYLGFMQATHCLNCGETLQSDQVFCPHCGQKTTTSRLTFRHLGYDFLQTFLRTEKGLFNLLRGLTMHPGRVAAEYARGKRKSYFSPFAFMGICIALMLLINNWLQPYIVQPEPSPEVLARMPDAATMKLYLVSLERIGEVQRFANKHMNTISVLVSPYFAFWLWLFFRRRGWNLAEITVAYILFSAFSNLVTAILIAPFLSFTGESWLYYPLLYGSIFLQVLYVAWGMKDFFHFKTAGGYWKVLLVLGLAGLVGFIVILILYFLYVYHGHISTVLRYL